MKNQALSSILIIAVFAVNLISPSLSIGQTCSPSIKERLSVVNRLAAVMDTSIEKKTLETICQCNGSLYYEIGTSKELQKTRSIPDSGSTTEARLYIYCFYETSSPYAYISADSFLYGRGFKIIEGNRPAQSPEDTGLGEKFGYVLVNDTSNSCGEKTIVTSSQLNWAINLAAQVLEGINSCHSEIPDEGTSYSHDSKVKDMKFGDSVKW